MSMSQISQVYDEVLSEYREMMLNIQRNEDICANLAKELQKEFHRVSEMSTLNDELYEVFKKIQMKDEIVNNSTQKVDSASVSRSERDSWKESTKYASNLLQKISTAFQELDSTEDKINE